VPCRVEVRDLEHDVHVRMRAHVVVKVYQLPAHIAAAGLRRASHPSAAAAELTPPASKTSRAGVELSLPSTRVGVVRRNVQ
jgi:hypothetical protein